jgi:hypothetical protein
MNISFLENYYDMGLVFLDQAIQDIFLLEQLNRTAELYIMNPNVKLRALIKNIGKSRLLHIVV